MPPEAGRRLTAAQERAFDRRARRLGHDTGRLADDGELVSCPRVPSVDAMRALSAATPGQRGQRARLFFNPVIEIRRSLGQGVHDRLEAAAFAGAEISPADEARAAAHFPFPTRILSVRYRTVRAGETWDLSVRGDGWGLDDRDDIMNVVNVGCLCIEPGATVVVRGNLLILTVARLIVSPAGDGAAPYQLAILPTPFSVDSDTGPHDGASGPPGGDGGDGGDGTSARTAPTWLGPRLTGPVVPGAADGRPGEDGTPGGDGARGRTGGASKFAEITIGELTGALTILATAGRGGDGGHGGNGGRGGDGGHGAPGQRTLRGVLAPGRGGDGGGGGDGGDGGRGGHGGISSNVFVSVPAGQAGRVRVLAHPSAGGRGGPGGRGGDGGGHGRGGAHAAEPGGAARRPAPGGRPSRTSRAPAGADGARGRDGRARPAPPVFVNERPVEPMTTPAQVPPPARAVQSRDTRRGGLAAEGATTQGAKR